MLCNAPLFASTRDDLATTKEAIAAAEKRKEALQEQEKDVEESLEELQEKLVKTAARIQESERAVAASELKLRSLDTQLIDKTAELEQRKEKFAALVQAALRLSRIPPEAVVMMPGDTGKTIKAAQALQMATESIKKEAARFGAQLAELQTLKAQVKEKHALLVGQQATLEKERSTINVQLAKRKKMHSSLGWQQKEEDKKLRALARKAENLQSLMSSINNRTRSSGGGTVLRADDRPVIGGQKGRLRSFLRAKGEIRTPTTGRVAVRFGDADQSLKSKGVKIDAPRRAQVISPYDGEVIFTGPFLAYGNLVILRHSDDFHTLLAGLSQIEVRTGQFLLEGEPIGAMGDKSKNRLYVEIRRKNQPVDPAPWIHGL